MLLKDGKIINDVWKIITLETTNIDTNDHCLISWDFLDEFLKKYSFIDLGVLFPCDQDIQLLSPYIHNLKLIALNFPVFTDGRAFSQARKIRQQFKFQYELRATGHMLPDQYQFLIRSGFTTIELGDDSPLCQWQIERKRFSGAYQPSVLAEKRIKNMFWQT